MITKTKFAAFALALSLFAAACGDDAKVADTAADSETTATTEAMADSETTATTGAMADSETTATTEAMADSGTDDAGTIVDVASNAGDFTVLLAAADAAGLVETLNGPGPLTVFAPTDEAFAAALTDLGLTQDELLADTDTLKSILTYHVVAGKVLSTDLTDGMTAATVNGADLTVDLSDGVKINDANVVKADIMADNGIIHVIDKVLIP